MRVAWLTPLSANSGISKYSVTVVPALREHVDVDVFAPESERDPYRLEGDAPKPLRADEAVVSALAGYDLVVHNAGNNPAFHDVIHAVHERVPGLVVVHDKRMHGFFHHMWCVAEGRPGHYAHMLRYYYGERGERVAATVLRGGVSVDAFDDVPLIEPSLWNATAAVVHSKEAADLVSARYGDLLPVAELGLPFAPEPLGVGALRSRSELGVGDDEVLVVSHGGVYEQKRLESLLHAVAREPAVRDVVRVAIVGGGAADYVARLRELVDRLGLVEKVVITGRVDDTTMYSWVAAADIAVNLRYPSMESASLTLAEQMHYAKPVIATDVSYYSQLPDSVAVKIPILGEIDHLRGALRRLVADAGSRRSMGEAAAAFAAEHHDPARYADGFLRFAERVAGRSTSLRAFDVAADRLLGLDPARACAEAVAIGSETVAVRTP